MYEFKTAPINQECSRDCLVLKAQLARQKINGEAVDLSKSAESPAGIALETVLGADTSYALEFIQIMSEQGMPGAKILCTESCEAKPRSFLGSLVGRGPEIAKGSAIYGYAIGTLKVTGESAWRGTLYLGSDERLWVHEGTTGNNPDGSTEIVTSLDQTTVYFGKVYERDDNPKDGWSRYHSKDKLPFREMPVKDVLYEIARINLAPPEQFQA